MATLLADSPTAPSDEPKAPDASAGAPPAPLNGAAPASADAPAQPGAPTPVAHACARCAAPMAPGQDWCLRCGAGAPGSIGSPSWRSAATILTATAVLALGAAAAAFAALSQHAPATRMVTATVAQATPTVTVPSQTTPNLFGNTGATPVLPKTKFKPPKIPLTANKLPRTTDNNDPFFNTGGSNTKNKTNFKTKTTTTGGGTEPKPTAVVLDTDAAATYNPYNYSASGFGDPSLTIDGDTSTSWTAQVDPVTAPKMAEGVLIDLKARQKLSTLALVTSTPGLTVQVYGATGQTAPTSITDPAWVSLSHSRVVKKKHVRISLKDSTKAFNFLTLWISQAPASSTREAPGHVSVNELELFPAQ
ncbi:MAG TPA: hypothetical protein VFY36_12590 [Solirubrobacteraceae bacterium]|nr:hypothetical protein [Solirubrobacteraceae bacterium]